MATPEKSGFFSGLKEGIKGIGSGISKDVGSASKAGFGSYDKMRDNMISRGVSPADADSYIGRTQATQARNASLEKDGGNRGNLGNAAIEEPTPEELGPRLNNPAQQYRQALMNRYSSAPAPMAGPEVTPEIFNRAIGSFEAQRGAGQMPYQMMPYGLASFQPQQPFGQNVSPAFQYAAQNYSRLGGAQRLMPRPMEMMSVAERQQINDMARAMAEQQAEQKAVSDFNSTASLFSGGKGAGRNTTQNVRQDLMPLFSAFQKFS